MEQVILKPKNLAHSEVQVKPIQILRCSEAALVDTEPDATPFSDIIQAAYCYDLWDGSHLFIGNQAAGQARGHHGSQVTNQQEVT